LSTPKVFTNQTKQGVTGGEAITIFGKSYKVLSFNPDNAFAANAQEDYTIYSCV
jgi:hypothetical protein